MGSTAEEIVFCDDRPFAVSFVRRLVSQAVSRALFVDPYFGFGDIRDFALSAWSGSCRVSALTSARVKWNDPLGHLATGRPHGELMQKDIEEINRVRTLSGMSSVEVAVMADPQIHDRFLVVDETVGLFGGSFHSLGDGAVSMASKVRDVAALLTLLLDASAAAESFSEFWTRTKLKRDGY